MDHIIYSKKGNFKGQLSSMLVYTIQTQLFSFNSFTTGFWLYHTGNLC